MGNITDALKEFVSFIVKVLKGTVRFLDIAEGAIAWAKVFIPTVLGFIEVEVDKQDEKLAGLPPSLTEEEITIKKELAFKAVGDKTEGYFSASPSYVPRGIIDGLTKLVVYVKHHSDQDERDDRARSYGILQSLDAEDTKVIIEQGLNKGFTGFGQR